MAKKFNIHDWQSKQRLKEGKGSTLSLSKSDMEKLKQMVIKYYIKQKKI